MEYYNICKSRRERVGERELHPPPEPFHHETIPSNLQRSMLPRQDATQIIPYARNLTVISASPNSASVPLAVRMRHPPKPTSSSCEFRARKKERESRVGGRGNRARGTDDLTEEDHYLRDDTEKNARVETSGKIHRVEDDTSIGAHTS